MMRRNNAAALASVVMAVGALAMAGMANAGPVSPPSSAKNDPINTDANKAEKAQTPGSTSFTEAQAKGHIENAGYTDVSGLKKTPKGFWTGMAKKGGKPVQVSVDYKGAVSSK
jgi:hypothetical protein